MTDLWIKRVLICLLILSFCLNIWLLMENRSLMSSWQPIEQKQLQVHVLGAVRQPGVYQLSRDARVADAIEIAGGALDDAFLEQLNLAKPLFDGEQLLIASKPVVSAGENAQHMSSQTDANLININTAQTAELERLPGIGPAKATAIVNYRQQHGAFARAEDLLKVSGIGEKTFAQLKELITVR